MPCRKDEICNWFRQPFRVLLYTGVLSGENQKWKDGLLLPKSFNRTQWENILSDTHKLIEPKVLYINRCILYYQISYTRSGGESLVWWPLRYSLTFIFCYIWYNKYILFNLIFTDCSTQSFWRIGITTSAIGGWYSSRSFVFTFS